VYADRAGRLPHHHRLEHPGERRGQRDAGTGQPDVAAHAPLADQQQRGEREPDDEQCRDGPDPVADERRGEPRRGDDRQREDRDQVGGAQRDRRRDERRRRQRRAPQHAGHPQRLAQAQRQDVVAQQGDVQRRPRLTEAERRQHRPPGGRPQCERAGVQDECCQQPARRPGGRPPGGGQDRPVDEPRQVDDGRGEDHQPDDQPGAAKQRPRAVERPSGPGSRYGGHVARRPVC
jgi:hypothetical protein